MRGSKKLIIGCIALVLAGASLVLPGSPASAAGTTYLFSTLTAGQTVVFDPDADVLRFDGPAISAASVRLNDGYNGLIVTAAAKTVYVNGLFLAGVSTTNVTFADGSVVRIGDGTTSNATDGAAQTWSLAASSKANLLMGLGGLDHLIGGAGPDRLLGTPTYSSPPGPAVLEGGPGNDTYAIDPAMADTVVEQASAGTDTIETPSTYALTTPNVENLTLVGSTPADGTGNQGPNVLVGNEAQNHLHGLGGNDTLIQGSGDDLEGGTGDDTYVITSQSYAVVEAAGEGTDLLKTPIGGGLPANIENGALTGTGAENLSGNELKNALVGNGAPNGLNGAQGDDTLTGGGGSDSFFVPSVTGLDVITDFATKSDRVLVSSGWAIGSQGEPRLDRPTNRTGPGGFSPKSELVVITRNLSSLTMAHAAAAIGSATSRYATGDRRLFLVDNGTTSQLVVFQSAGNDARVSASELRPILTLKNRTGLSVTDFGVY
ncbi:hypothetical protein [Aquihabitans sp. McL0605]|uniref:hypothetical protein n=1 Tax=Aquihabitans sp. McL0605 TaxID=3415671 RepID=UPI003CF9130D